MKKMLVVTLGLLSLFIVMGTAGFRSIPSLLDRGAPENNCTGYTIIAYDEGIDCNGDTIRLVRVNGFAERIR